MCLTYGQLLAPKTVLFFMIYLDACRWAACADYFNIWSLMGHVGIDWGGVGGILGGKIDGILI